jgi:integrase
MTWSVRPYKRRNARTKQFEVRGWEADIVVRLPDGEMVRERVRTPASSKSGAKAWAAAREAELVRNGKPKKKEVPTLKDFAPRFMEGYAKANRQKPSTMFSKGSILKNHLLPRFGDRKLDSITSEDVQRLKAELSERAPKTVNNILSMLGRMLRVAVEWDAIEQVPATVKLLRATSPEVEFYDFAQFERLVSAAEALDWRIHAMVLLGGDAGLRSGEILALEWTDLDFDRGTMHVQRSEWCGHVTLPKGGRSRRVPMTQRLAELLRAHKSREGKRVLFRAGGETATRAAVHKWLKRAQRLADLPDRGALHVLRHTYCSRLAMLGAPARAIQELAGHQNLTTTQRYMHLSPAAKDAAVRLLDASAENEARKKLETGLETGQGAVSDNAPQKSETPRIH